MIRRLLAHRCVQAAVLGWGLGCSLAWAQTPADAAALAATGADPLVVALVELARVSPTGLWVGLAAYLLSRRGPWVIRVDHTHHVGGAEGAPPVSLREER